MGALFKVPKLPPIPIPPPTPVIPEAVAPPVSGDADTLLATLRRRKATQTIFGGAQNAFAGPTGDIAIKTLLGQ